MFGDLKKRRALDELRQAQREIWRGKLRRTHAIPRARTLGLTWSEIGSALGMSASGASALIRETKPKTDVETKAPDPPRPAPPPERMRL